VFNTRLEKFKNESTREIAADKLRNLIGQPSLGLNDALKLMPPAVNVDLRLLPRTTPAAHLGGPPQRRNGRGGGQRLRGGGAETVAFEENRETSDSAVAWLQAQVNTQRKALEKAEQALVEFRAANQTGCPGVAQEEHPGIAGG
jgi:hypothetical protein